jgi:hypothetical protein
VSTIPERLAYLREEIRAERISYGEIAELQGLAEHIDPDDVELLEWAGVPEFPEEDASEPAMEAANTVPLPDLSFLSDADRDAVSDVFSDFGARCAQAGIDYAMSEEGDE